ncbi:1646_t:CDS:2 [Acaulospora morrowiae]|uniref:1646_t:CDS:1 n=1 Tax=Acaulospora morrowiae TaxID=94023 RepID=A0A9N9BD80_9GLOM|nr:1646_t:CDS:2 [Acaulospora morrowiae]
MFLLRRNENESSINIFLRQIIALECRDYSDPFSYKSIKVNCDIIKNENYARFLNSTKFVSPSSAFVIDFTCGSSDVNLCKKAKNAFLSAGQRIASVIQFNTPINVKASFDKLSTNTLGQASPARLIPLKDRDGIIRLYPQALVKQMQFPKHPEFNNYDILAEFTTTAKWFFKEDVNIQKDQYDFEYVITHEIIHGLGFISGWREWFLSSLSDLTPYPLFLDDSTDPNKLITYTGFFEMAFDRYMMLNLTKKTMITTLAQEINRFAPIGKKFASLSSFEKEFQSSPQALIAKNLSLAAIIPYTMDFVTHDSTPVILETSLNPYSIKSSISHVDTLYTDTSDFLMVYDSKHGIRFDDLAKNYGGVIGSKLIKVLETLGCA